MTAVGLGQQGSPAVGSGFESAVPNISTIFSQYFSIPDINDTLKGCTTKFFGTVRQTTFEGNLDNPPSLLSINFFATRNFLKHRRVPRRNFSAL